jgi:molybdopterin converting factor small subunit
MKVIIQYAAQARDAAGIDSESIEIDSPVTVSRLVRRLVDDHGDPLGRVLLNAAGEPHPSVLIFVGDERVQPEELLTFRPGDVVCFLPPISGG